jgi:hypothetical protein
MKKLLLAASFGLALFSLSGQAMAVCAGTQLNLAQIRAKLNNNTVCVPNGSGWEWQEQHRGTNSGTLHDFKRGVGHPTDPETQVGTWSTTAGNPATVTHSYTGGGSYTFSVFSSNTGGAPSDICFDIVAGGSSPSINGTVKAGSGSGTGCP